MPTNKKKGSVSVAQINEWKKKAEKWDALEKKIYNIYFDDEGNERADSDPEGGDLGTIGEICATHLGYL